MKHIYFLKSRCIKNKFEREKCRDGENFY